MPRQTYTVSFLARPQNESYRTDMMGAMVPIMFMGARDANAYLARFNSHSLLYATFEQSTLMAKRLQTKARRPDLSIIAKSLATHMMQPLSPSYIATRFQTRAELEKNLLSGGKLQTRAGLEKNLLSGGKLQTRARIAKNLLTATDRKKIGHAPDLGATAKYNIKLSIAAGHSSVGQKANPQKGTLMDQRAVAARNRSKLSLMHMDTSLAVRPYIRTAEREDQLVYAGQKSSHNSLINREEFTALHSTASRESQIFTEERVLLRATDLAMALIDHIDIVGKWSPRVPGVIEENLGVKADRIIHLGYLESDAINSGLKRSRRALLHEEKYADAERVSLQANIIDLGITMSQLLKPAILSSEPILDASRDIRHGILPQDKFHGRIVGQYSDLFPVTGSDDRLDLMDIPNKDYPYEQILPYDVNGVPLEPLSQTNVANVVIKHPIQHPFPQWANVAGSDVWVNLWPLKDVIINLTTIWRRNMSRLAGATLHQGLIFLLEELYNIIDPITKYTPDYHRVFRLTRWYAERVVLNNTVTVLKRTYVNWQDAIRATGNMGTAVTIQGLRFDQAAGMISSNGPSGSLSMDLTNYIDGVFTFSCVINSLANDGNSYVAVEMDGKEIGRILNDGLPHRVKYPALAGHHHITLRWNGKMGESVNMSGFVLSGAVFTGAETELRDPGQVQGAKAIHFLLADLMKYYQDHWDSGKEKGHMVINQRKPWIKN